MERWAREPLVFDQEEFNASRIPDNRVYLLHEAIKVVLFCYKQSLAHAAAKSCIWSAIMIRCAYHLQESGFSDVRIVDQVEGVQHKEATLVIEGYHISRSNFTKLCRSILKKQIQMYQKREREMLAQQASQQTKQSQGTMDSKGM